MGAAAVSAIAGGGVGVVAVVVVLTLWFKIKRLKKRARQLEEQVDTERELRRKVEDQLTLTAAEARENKVRYRNHVEGIREEVEGLRDDLDKCVEPEVVRQRLDRLGDKTKFREYPR